jgi:hypothetical protein
MQGEREKSVSKLFLCHNTVKAFGVGWGWALRHIVYLEMNHLTVALYKSELNFIGYYAIHHKKSFLPGLNV